MNCRGRGDPAHVIKDCPNAHLEGQGKGSGATALTGVVEYRDLEAFSQLEGIYFAVAQEEVVEYLCAIFDEVEDPEIAFSDWIIG